MTSVTAYKGSGNDDSIGRGNGGECESVTIGGTAYYYDGDYDNDGDEYLQSNPLIYQP